MALIAIPLPILLYNSVRTVTVNQFLGRSCRLLFTWKSTIEINKWNIIRNNHGSWKIDMIECGCFFFVFIKFRCSELPSRNSVIYIVRPAFCVHLSLDRVQLQVQRQIQTFVAPFVKQKAQLTRSSSHENCYVRVHVAAWSQHWNEQTNKRTENWAKAMRATHGRNFIMRNVAKSETTFYEYTMMT